jgi:hypothetical protein
MYIFISIQRKKFLSRETNVHDETWSDIFPLINSGIVQEFLFLFPLFV